MWYRWTFPGYSPTGTGVTFALSGFAASFSEIDVFPYTDLSTFPDTNSRIAGVLAPQSLCAATFENCMSVPKQTFTFVQGTHYLVRVGSLQYMQDAKSTFQLTIVEVQGILLVLLHTHHVFAHTLNVKAYQHPLRASTQSHAQSHMYTCTPPHMCTITHTITVAQSHSHTFIRTLNINADRITLG